MFRAFMEPDKLHEGYKDRQTLISNLKSIGKNYNFHKYSTPQLFYIWQKEAAKHSVDTSVSEEDYEMSETAQATCEECGCTLTDGGFCPRCSDGDEDNDFYSFDYDLSEDFFDVFTDRPSTKNWASRTPIQNNATAPQITQTASKPVNQSSAHVNIVTIVYDYKAHKLRARADDGVHGEANVAFPNNLRNTEGQQYEVEDLIWNGKNYRVSGAITPV